MVLSAKLAVAAALSFPAVGCGKDKVEKAAGTAEELADATIDLNI